MKLPRIQSLTFTPDPLVQHPRLAIVVSLALATILIPILSALGGVRGPLGPSIPLFFLVPVLLAAALGGQRAGVLVSVVAILAWDWFFIPPQHMVTIASARDVVALIVFLIVALLTGQLATSLRRRTQEALRRARGSEALYDLSMALIARQDLADVLPLLTQRLRTTFNLEACAVLLPGEGGTGWQTAGLAGPMPAELRVEDHKKVAAIAAWVSAEGRPSTLSPGQGNGSSGHRLLSRASRRGTGPVSAPSRRPTCLRRT